MLLYYNTSIIEEDEIYQDNNQNDYDWSDEYQGCPDYMEYINTWN